jgi:hypothetical protein
MLFFVISDKLASVTLWGDHAESLDEESIQQASLETFKRSYSIIRCAPIATMGHSNAAASSIFYFATQTETTCN